jgi:hypothetical protein
LAVGKIHFHRKPKNLAMRKENRYTKRLFGKTKKGKDFADGMLEPA